MKKYFSSKCCDRSDGWRIKNVDPLMAMVPFFMRSRIDSQVSYRQVVDLEPAEEFIKAHKNEFPDLTITVIVVAALVRIFASRPYLNRFSIHNNLYARKSLRISLVVKQSIVDDAVENVSITEFEPEDTLIDVLHKISESIRKNKMDDTGTGTSKAISVLHNLPSCFFRLFVRTVFFLDKHGILPKAFIDISPWHSSVFITNMGSIGIDSVYHHLYEFGTTSLFVSIGKKTKNYVMNDEEELVPKRSIDFKIVIDERICDGYYYAKSMRMWTNIFNNPEQLLFPPSEVKIDEGVGRERLC